MHTWPSANRFRPTPPALLIAALLLACAAATPRLMAQGDLELPLLDDDLSPTPGAATGANGETSRTITPDTAYASDGYYATEAGGGYAAGGVAYSELLGAHMRARYNTRSYGQTRGNLDLGTMKLYDQGDSAWFLDGQVALNDDSQFGYNVGVGYRFLTMPLLPGRAGSQKLAGISLWTDGMLTVNDNFFSQLGVSLEYLGDDWDLRSNVYVPLSDKQIGEFSETGGVSFSGEFLSLETIAGVDEPLTVAEAEVARRLGDLEAWAFLGGYGLFGDDTETAGYKIGLRGYATPDVSVSFAVVDDDEFGTNLVFSGTWFIGRTRTNTPIRRPLEMRMREPVIRNDYIAIRQSTVSSGTALAGDLDGDGDDEFIRIVHVDSTAADGGDGTFENPLNELSDIAANSTTDSIVLVHGGSTLGNSVTGAATPDVAVLQDGQRLLGEGGGVDQTVSTTRFGTISLPETAPGAQAGAIPTITNVAGTGDAVTLANETLEVSNLSITGGARGIVAPAGNTGVSINNVNLAGTSGDGIVLTPGTIFTTEGDPSTEQVNFNPVISDVTFANIGGDDIDIDAASPAASTVPILASITINDVTSTGGAGVGIDLRNASSAVGTTITDYSHDGGDASTGAILITGAGTTDGAVAVTDATITNQGGFGISIVDSDASHVLSSVDITDTMGTAFDVSGGPTDNTTITSFTGTITQTENAAAVAIRNGHGGTITFTEAVENVGVVNATNGTGVQFDGADGTYSFNSAVVLNGGDAGIDFLNNSDANVTMTDATIVSPMGTAVNVEGGAAALSFTGQITQANAFATVSVQGDHTGTLTFNEGTTDAGVITATSGAGLTFNAADGAYLFNDGVTLTGATRGLDIQDSDGTFTLSDAAITDPTGEAVNIVGGGTGMVLTYTGTVTQGSNAAALSVTGGNEGNVTFLPLAAGDPSITATNGPGLVFNNADGSYAVIGELALTGGATIDITNDSDGAFSFSDATITNPAGTALNINGGDATVTYTGLIAQANGGLAVSVVDHANDAGDTGSVTFNEANANEGVVNATNGGGLFFSNADGTYSFNNAVTLNGTVNVADTGIDIVGDSDGTFTFADATINSPTGTAVNVAGGSADVNFTGLITQANNAAAVTVSGGHEGTLMFDEATAGDGVVTATGGTGIDFDNADGAYFFNNDVTLNGGDAAVNIDNGSSGLMLFASGEIINPTGDAFTVADSDADVTFNGTITDSTGNAVSITGNTGGAVALGGEVTSTGTGVLVQNNTGGAFSFTGGATLTTGASDAVTLASNTDTTITFGGNLDIDTTTGVGFNATGSEGVAVTGTGNTIDTTTGVGLNLNNATVATAGVAFDSVSVNGATSGIVMNDVSGGAVTIGATGSNIGDGGVIQNTTGVGVELTNVESVSLNNLQATGATGDGIAITHNNARSSSVTVASSSITGATAQGVDAAASGTGTFSLVMTDNAVSGAGAESARLRVFGSATNANATLSGNQITNTSESALLVTGETGTLNLLINNSNAFSNSGAASPAVSINSNGTAVLNTTVLNNTFNNGSAGAQPINIATDAGGQATVRLSMFGNTATAGGAAANDDYFLVNNGGSFTIENLTVPMVPADQVAEQTLEEANSGSFNFSPNVAAFGTDAGNVPTP